MYYVTMQITFPIPQFARKERNLHCDVVHVTTKWVSRLVLEHAIAAIQTSRLRPIVGPTVYVVNMTMLAVFTHETSRAAKMYWNVPLKLQ